MILITGHVILTPEHRERMTTLGAEHSARSRGEAGCLGHRCHVDVEQQGRLVFVEEWADIAAVRTPSSGLDPGSRCPRPPPSSPTPDQVRDDVRALSRQPPVIRIYAAEDITAKLMG